MKAGFINRLDRIIEALLLGLVIYLPLAFGGASPYRRAPALIAGVCLFSLTVLRIILPHDDKNSPLDADSVKRLLGPVCLFGMFLLVIMFQLTPMPRFAADFLGLPGAILEGRFVPMHPAPETGFLSFLTYLTAFSTFFAIVTVYRDREKLQRLIIALIAVGLFESLYGLLEWVSKHQHIFGYAKKAYTTSATGTFINRNHFAGYLEMTLSMLGASAIYLYMKNKKKVGQRSGITDKIILMTFAVIVGIGAMLASGSRAAPVCLAASVLLAGTMFIRLKDRKKYFLTVIAVSVIALVFCLWIGADPLNPRYKGLPEEVMAGDARPRVFIGALKILLHAPFFGAGAGTFADAFQLYRPATVAAYYDHAHNDYLELLAETGLLGFLTFSAGILWTISATIKARINRSSRFARAFSLGALIGVFSIGFHGLLDFNLSIPANLTTFFVLLGCGLVAADRHFSRRK